MMLWAANMFAHLRWIARPAVLVSAAAIVLGTAVVVEAPSFTRRATAANTSRAPIHQTNPPERPLPLGNPRGSQSSDGRVPADAKPLLTLPFELLQDIRPADARQTGGRASPATPSVSASTRSARNGSTPNAAIRGLYVGAAKSRILWMEVTAYCPCTICCGPTAQGVTASGKGVDYANGYFVAADAELFAFGTKLRIPEYHQGQAVEVVDRGSAIKGRRIDVFFSTHDQAAAWGRRWLPVERVAR